MEEQSDLSLSAYFKHASVKEGTPPLEIVSRWLLACIKGWVPTFLLGVLLARSNDDLELYKIDKIDKIPWWYSFLIFGLLKAIGDGLWYLVKWWWLGEFRNPQPSGEAGTGGRDRSDRSYRSQLLVVFGSAITISNLHQKMKDGHAEIRLYRQHNQKVIVKYADHWRIRNERDVLLRFQAHTPHIRPLLDQVEDASGNLILILKHLDEDALHALDKRQLARSEVKGISRGVLKGLRVLHDDGLVHADVKPSNILLNFDPADNERITDVQHADFESTVAEDSEYAKAGDMIGTAIFRSPEAHLQIQWGRPTDGWSFGTTLISLLYGGGFHIFKPDVPLENDDYDSKMLMKHHRCFGPFPLSYHEIADDGRLGVLTWIMENRPAKSLKPFSRQPLVRLVKRTKTLF